MNRWKNYVWMAAGISALGAIGAYTAKPLLAQIRAALVQNVDEPGRTPYLSIVELDCPATNVCDVAFAAIPAGKRLVATNLTGLLFLLTPGVVDRALLTFNQGNGINLNGVYYVPTVLQTGVFGIANNIGINAAIGLFVDGPDQPRFHVDATTNFLAISGHVGLSGYLVDCALPGSCAAIVR